MTGYAWKALRAVLSRMGFDSSALRQSPRRWDGHRPPKLVSEGSIPSGEAINFRL